MKKFFTVTLILIICSVAFAQELNNDIIQINYEKKSLAKAMMLSSLFPGAGQFYANRRSITTYIFPLIEIGLIAGYFINYNDGVDAEAKYEDYADLHYNRDQQCFAQDDLIEHDMNNSNFYADHFRLDGIERLEDDSWYVWENNTQHFYEDIGKYNKYVFGWDDWFDIYATDAAGNTVSPEWLTDEYFWIGNSITNPESEYINSNYSDYTIYSGYRSEYIQMRKDAETMYDKAELFSFGIVANHILAAIDAVRLTRIHNREYLSNTSKVEIKFAPIFVNNSFSPALMVTKRF